MSRISYMGEWKHLRPSILVSRRRTSVATGDEGLEGIGLLLLALLAGSRGSPSIVDAGRIDRRPGRGSSPGASYER